MLRRGSQERRLSSVALAEGERPERVFDLSAGDNAVPTRRAFGPDLPNRTQAGTR